jgi:hypothetical protein
MNKTIITISRHWDNPSIKTTVSQEGIALEMNMDDFFVALKKEFAIHEFRDEIRQSIGSVTTVIKQTTFDQRFNDAFASAWFEKRLENAIKKVIAGMKEESTKVMTPVEGQ